MAQGNHLQIQQQFGNCSKWMGHPAHRSLCWALSFHWMKQMCSQQLAPLYLFSLLSPNSFQHFLFPSTPKNSLFSICWYLSLVFWWPLGLCGTLVPESGSHWKWSWATGSHHPVKDHCYSKFQTGPFGPCVVAPVAPQHTADVFCHKSRRCLTSMQGTWPRPLCNACVNKQRQQRDIWSLGITV